MKRIGDKVKSGLKLVKHALDITWDKIKDGAKDFKSDLSKLEKKAQASAKRFAEKIFKSVPWKMIISLIMLLTFY